MSRINLLTIHYGENKGAFLQCYATKKILESLGHRVTIINLCDRQWSVAQRFSSLNSFKTIPNMLDFMRLRKKYLAPLTPPMTHLIPELVPHADYAVVGSDQTWNPDITQKNYLAYFLSFVPENQKRIALASSLGVTRWEKFSPEMTEKIAAELKKFSAIAVRETSGVEICRNAFGIDGVEQICDPTIAWGDYSELSGPIRNRDEVFAFIFVNSPTVYALAEAARRQLQLPVRITSKTVLARCPQTELKNCRASSLVGNVSLSRFLHGIAGARFVVTDSFHATVFCLLNRKNFAVIGPQKGNDRFGRIAALLEYFRLLDRIVASPEDLEARKAEIFRPVVYSEEFDARLNAWREKFLGFVKAHIS